MFVFSQVVNATHASFLFCPHLLWLSNCPNFLVVLHCRLYLGLSRLLSLKSSPALICTFYIFASFLFIMQLSFFLVSFSFHLQWAYFHPSFSPSRRFPFLVLHTFLVPHFIFHPSTSPVFVLIFCSSLRVLLFFSYHFHTPLICSLSLSLFAYSVLKPR